MLRVNRYAVLGNPIAHSLSPIIHQKFAEQTGIDLLYEKKLVAEHAFGDTVTKFFQHGGKGLNITLPFKQQAFDLAEVKTPRASIAKAVNTLWMQEGRLYGDNTDGIGFLRDLRRYISLKGKKVLLLGAGGAARGIIDPLLESNIEELVIVNRSEEKATLLQKDFPAIKSQRFDELSHPFDLIINATSASFTNTRFELSHSLLKLTTFCYDLAYDIHHSTPFVDWAQSQQLLAKDGLGMLVEQAAEAFFIWHGLKPKVDGVLVELKN